MTRRRRIAVLAAVTALALSACANQDSDIQDLTEALEETEALSNEQVDACTEGFEDADFSQDQLNDIASAETLGELEGDLGERVQAILDQCIEDPEGTTTEGSGESGEDETTTTEP